MLRAAFVAIFIGVPALAQDLATADQITAAIAGNTVMGSMAASGAYSEFYAADGTIRAADYRGTWAIAGNAMCFTYGGGTAICWNVRLQGDQITWISSGAEEGTGTILPGNPNGW
jgi:hypothetical protein